MTIRSLPAIAVSLFLGVASSACQTSPSAPASAAPSASKSAETKPVDPGKPPSEEAVRVIATNCFNCHGPNGQSPSTIPSLSTLSADDIASRMKSFKSGGMTSTVMGRHAKAYSDAEIDATAEYIAGLKKSGGTP